MIGQTRNRLLNFLTDASRERILSVLEPVDLPKNFKMGTTDEVMEYVYFMSSGIGSVALRSDKGVSTEAGMFGSEGFSPTAVAVGGVRSSYDIIVQAEGSGHRITADAFRTLMKTDNSLCDTLMRYIYVFALQASYTAHSNALDKIDKRLARWILMCHDRVQTGTINLTHEYLALMLGIRRPSVTTSLHVLEGHHLIRSERGVITVRNRKGLEEYAGSSYGGAEKEYDLLFHKEMKD